MEPPAGNSVIKFSPNQWALGSKFFCEKLVASQCLPTDSIVDWTEDDDRYCPLEGDKFDPLCTGEAKRVQIAGESFATWSIGNIFVKVRPWCDGIESEATTIKFFRKSFPEIPVPEVVHTWLEKMLERSFLLTKGMEGEVLDNAWARLSDSQRLARISDIVIYIDVLAQKTSIYVETCTGLGIQEIFFMQKLPESHPI